MGTVLAIGFLVLLYVDKAGTLLCFECTNVAEDNTCVHSEKTCNYGNLNYCFSRLVSKGNVMLKADRGCVFACRSIKRKHENYEENMLCCVKELCNVHNFWTNH